MQLPGTVASAALDHLTAEVAVLDADGVIVDTNRAWEDYAESGGLERGETVGSNYLDACEQSDDQWAADARAGLRALLDGERDSFELEYPCHTPERKQWFLLQASRFETGDCVFVVMAHTDVTERVLAEREVERRNETLTQLVGLLAHDVRNPLSVAKGHAEMLAAEDSSERADLVVDALDRIDQLVEDALTFARTGVVDADEESVALAAAARDAWANVDTEDATLTVTAPDDHRVLAVPELLAHLFENLFRNSVEHGGEGVAVTVGVTEDGFYVADDGPGIPEDEREDVFEMGYTNSEDGTGFGLAIVKHVADAHGWDTDVSESQEGGARFDVTLEAASNPRQGH